MNLAFLASFIALILVISVSIRKQNKRFIERENAFWERERLSNSVRKKSLDNLDYIRIPLERFPTHLLKDNPAVMSCIEIVEALTSQKIVNLTGYTNTDLKFEYGTANLALLSEYDDNYTVLVRTLQKWADELINAGNKAEAAILMEFAISTGTDIGRTYYLLAEYYVEAGKSRRIDDLITTAEQLHSSKKNTIVKQLRESYPDVF